MSDAPYSEIIATFIAIRETQDPIVIPTLPLTLTPSTVSFRASARREFGKDLRRLIKMVREAVLNPCE